MATRRTRLRTIGNVKTELGRVYRAALAGTMDWQDACAAARILRELRHIISENDIEARLVALERALDHGERPNGSKFVVMNGGDAHP